MAVSAEKKEPEVNEVGDSEFELMFGKASEEDVDLTDLSKDEKTPEELEAEKKAADEAAAAKADKKTPEEIEAEKVAEEAAKADEKTPEEIEAEKKAEEASALKAERDLAAKVQKEADEKVAKEAREKQAAEDKEQAEDREKRATITADEEAVNAEMAKDFPDVKKVMDIQQRISDAKWEQRFVDFQAGLVKQLNPTIQTVNAVATDSFERAVYGKHPDTQELLPEVEAWVDKQPAFLKAAYNNVLDKGTATETIELLDIFKGATGRNEQEGKSAEDIAAEAKAAEDKKKADEERERKLASQEGIRGRQDAKTDTAPSTFEDAFNAEASKAM